MPLERQVVSIPIGQGMDSKTDPKQVQVGELLLVTNAVHTSVGQLTPRVGHVSKPRSVTVPGGMPDISTGNALGVLESNLSLFDGDKVYSFSEDLDKWAYSGSKPAIKVVRDFVASPADTSVNYESSAVDSNGLEMVVWGYTSGGNQNQLNFTVRDTTSSTTVFTGIISQDLFPGFTLTGAPPFIDAKVLNISSKFYVFTTVHTTVGDRLFYLIVDATTPDSISNATAVSSNDTFYFDYSIAGGFIFIGAAPETGGPHRIYKFNPATNTSTSASVGDASSSAVSVAADASSSRVFFYFSDSAENLFYRVYDFSLSVILTSTLITTRSTGTTFTKLGATVSGTTSYILWTELITPINIPAIYAAKVTTSAVSVTDVLVVPNLFLESKPVLRPDGRLYFMGLYCQDPASGSEQTPSLQPTYFLLRIDIPKTITVAQVVAKFAAVEGPIVTNNTPAISVTSAGTYRFATRVATGGTTDFSTEVADNKPTYNVAITEFTFDEKIRTLPLASNLHSSGGFISLFDGAQVVESGFHLYPESATVSGQSAGGAIPSGGTYSYVAVYTWTDSRGQVSRSAPSVPKSFTTSGGVDVAIDLLIPALGVTDRATQNPDIFHAQTPVVTEIYRTVASGTIYYLVGRVTNDPTAFTLSFIDTLSDDAILASRQLYTTGGEVENEGPLPTTSFTEYKNRIVYIPSENPYQLLYSKQVISGVPVEFSSLFTIPLEQRGGKATVCASMDDKLIIFKNSNIYYMVGDGPAPSGVNNDFIYPQIVPSDVGCSNPSSVVLTPVGLMFKSEKGIYLLDRGLNVRYIGDKVESYNGNNITSAVLVENTTLVKFTLEGGDALVYDYYVNRWGVFTGLLNPVDAIVYSGAYVFLQSNGKASVEDSSLFTDDGVAYSMTATTGWLSFAQVQGFERVRRILVLGDYFSPHNFTLDVSYDFDYTPSQTTTIHTAADEIPYQRRIHLARQKCEALLFTLTVTPTTGGQGITLSSIAMEVGVKKGTNKMSAARSAG